MTPQTDRQDFVVIPSHRPPGTAPERARPGTPVILVILAAVIVPIALAWSAAFADEAQIVGVVLGIIGLITILARPFYGLLLFVALLYTRPEEQIQTLADMHFTLAVAVVTLIAMWFQLFMKREPFVKTPFLTMLLSFAAVVVIGSTQSNNVSDAAQDLGRLCILVILILNLVRTPVQYRQFITTIIVFTTYAAVMAIYQYFAGGALQETVSNGAVDSSLLRAELTGIFNDPNDLAATIVAGLGLCLSRVPRSGKLMRVFYIALSLVMAWSIFLTNSRGGMIALMVVLFGLFYISLKNKKVAVILGILAALGALTLGSGHMTDFNGQESSANSRFQFWHTGFDLLAARPALGVGFDGFMSENDGMTAHNSFVLCYGENGLIGYFFWMGCLYYCFRKPPKRGNEDGSDEDSLAAAGGDTAANELLGARLGLLGYLAASFWLSHTYEPIMYVMMPLPILAKLCSSGGANLYQGIKPWKDWRNIALIAVASIVLIEVMADHYISK